MNDRNPQIQEVQWSQSIRNIKKTTLSHIIISVQKAMIKRKSLKLSPHTETCYMQRNKDKDDNISLQKQCKWEDSAATYLKYWKEKLST